MVSVIDAAAWHEWHYLVRSQHRHPVCMMHESLCHVCAFVLSALSMACYVNSLYLCAETVTLHNADLENNCKLPLFLKLIIEANLELPDPVTAFHRMLELQTMSPSALPCKPVVSLSGCLFVP